MNLQTKILIVMTNSRLSGQSAAESASQQLAAARQAFDEQVAAIESTFDLECWNAFKGECSAAELARFEAALNYPV